MIDLINSLVTTQEANYMDINNESTIEFLEALEYSTVKKSKLSVPFWIKKIGLEAMNRIIYVLDRHGLAISSVNKKYASIEATSKLYELVDDIDTFRMDAKIKAYSMKLDIKEKDTNLVSTPSGIKTTGLDRKGFMYSAKQAFKLDTDIMAKHLDMIIENATKSITKTMLKYEDIALDEANYKELCSVVIKNYIANPNKKYNLEYNISDPRGRAIYAGLKRIFNPVSSKDARACLIAPSITVEEQNKDQMKDIYLFIAELVGSKVTNRGAKILAGMIAYKSRKLPELNTENLHEYIWLSRVYTNLDLVKANGKAKWNVPLEMDASMSLAQIEGAVLNSKELLVKTNAVGSKLQDPWFIKGTRRPAVKAIGTPTAYGSNQSPARLLKAKNIVLDKDELVVIKKEFNNGDFSIIKDFKNLLISNMNISSPTYTVQGWDEVYTVEVNKHKAVGATLDAYSVWNTNTKRDSIFFIHTPTTVPDYDRFKTYAATGLVHNLDSKIMDNVMIKLSNLNEWAIAIHDAVLCLPGSSTRSIYKDNLQELNSVGREVLVSYMQSIGATSTKANIDLANLLDKVTSNNLPFSENALK